MQPNETELLFNTCIVLKTTHFHMNVFPYAAFSDKPHPQPMAYYNSLLVKIHAASV